MNVEKFTSIFGGVELENKALRYGLLIVLLANLMLVYKVVVSKPAVVLTPPGLTEEVMVWHDRADEGYKKVWGLFFAKMLGNITPGESDLLTKSLGIFFDPKIFDSVNNAMAAQLDALALERVTLSFAPQRILFERESNTVFVTGYLESEGVSGDPKKNTRTYEMRIDVENYKPILRYIEPYDGVARTLDVKERMAEMEANKK